MYYYNLKNKQFKKKKTQNGGWWTIRLKIKIIWKRIDFEKFLK